MDYDSEERRRQREYRRKVIADWKAEAKALQDAGPNKRMLLREAKREAMRRIEDSARTEADFEKVLLIWNNVKIVEDWRVEKQEEMHPALPDVGLTEHMTIIPKPLNIEWWRQQLHGNFLDIIYDCPHEIHELISGRTLCGYIKELDARHKELLYYRAIRRWTPQRIAEHRGQTDRNIRGVYNRLIESLRRDMFEWLYPIYLTHKPLTLAYREFVKAYREQLDEVRDIEVDSAFDAALQAGGAQKNE